MLGGSRSSEFRSFFLTKDGALDWGSRIGIWDDGSLDNDDRESCGHHHHHLGHAKTSQHATSREHRISTIGSGPTSSPSTSELTYEAFMARHMPCGSISSTSAIEHHNSSQSFFWLYHITITYTFAGFFHITRPAFSRLSAPRVVNGVTQLSPQPRTY
jgi:hypothetical protein